MQPIPSRGPGHDQRRFEQIIGNSSALESALEQVQRVAPTNSTVLILGETGTGKELIARSIHNVSTRCGRPFVKLNCAAIPFELLESELFGHEKGAFTGAIAQKKGRFELAHTGRSFLMRSVIFRWPHSLNYFASCRNRNSNVWEAARRFGWMSVSWLQLTAIWARW